MPRSPSVRREKELLAKGITTRAGYDAALASYKKAMAAVAGAKATLKASVAALQVEADVSESNLELVKAGQPCEIQPDALPVSRFRGEVHMINLF